MQQGSEYILNVLEDIRLKLEYDIEPFLKIIDDLEGILIKKGQDYSGNNHQWHNFEFARDMSGLSSLEQVIVVMCSIKFSRLNTLLFTEKTANFESIEDNLKDLINYLVLLVGYLEFNKDEKNKTWTWFW